MIAALSIGSLLAVATLAFVMAPVIVGVRRARAPRAALRPVHTENFALAALREIEFDRVTGKLSDSDYAVLRERYANEALAVMRNTSSPAAVDDPIEAAVRAYSATHPSCASCGIRPEPDAIYCSNCGGYLAGTCDGCGIAVTAPGVRYCIGCGQRLAA
jgi:hypothetical protein